MRKSALFFWLLGFFAFSLFARADDADLVRHDGQCKLVRHTGFVLCYDERYEQASWVAYELTRAEAAARKVSRKDMKFESDPDVATGSATKDDYRKSGFDKGHLAPAADMRWSAAAMRECFLLSNISPQRHEFNAGVWEDLESAVRDAALRLGAVDVVTGPVLRSGLPTIGKDHVAVPELFYKVLLFHSGKTAQAIGFIIPNQITFEPFTAFAVPVDSVESVTGLDFFTTLSPQLEQAAEKTVDVSWWFAPNGAQSSRKKR